MHQRITVRQPEKARHRGRRLGVVASASGLMAVLALAPATSVVGPPRTLAPRAAVALPSPGHSTTHSPPSTSPPTPSIQGTGIVMSLVTQPLEALSSTNQYTPVLATSVGLPNPSTLVYHIRSGVKFSNGAALTATDVAWSIMHAVEPSLASATQMPSIASATPTGPLTVTVKLKTPNPVARADIAMTVLVQNAAFAKAHGSALGTASAVPIGTGPYKVSSDTASNITLVRSSGYWGKYPPFSSVVFPVITDDNSRELAIRSGSINGSELVDLKDIEQWASIPGVSVYKSPSNSLDLVGFDVSKPPLQRPARAPRHCLRYPEAGPGPRRPGQQRFSRLGRAGPGL